MESQYIAEKLLKDLYTKHVTEPPPARIYLDSWAEKENVEKQFAWDIYHEYLQSAELARNCNLQEIQLTPRGILEVERRGIADKDLIKGEELIRKKMLVALHALQQEKRDELIDWTEVRETADIQHHEFERNHEVLEHEGLIKRQAARCWKLTLHGYNLIASAGSQG